MMSQRNKNKQKPDLTRVRLLFSEGEKKTVYSRSISMGEAYLLQNTVYSGRGHPLTRIRAYYRRGTVNGATV